ncbi:MAG: universal stress protein [Chloroflexi bacterium]|nr:universal stress protein [Chloroflexota bacterium]
MLKHILVVSTPDSIEDTLQQTKPIARHLGARITLLCRLTPSSSPGGNHFIDPLEWHIHKVEVKTGIDEMAAELRQAGIDVHTELLDSTDPADIIDYAEKQHVDLVVMVRKTDNVSDLMNMMIKNSSVPIITLHHDYQPASDMQETECYQKIVVPLDGSQRAESALPMATMIAQLCNGELVLAHIVQKPEMPRRAPLSEHDLKLSEELVRTNHKQVKRYLEQTADRVQCLVKVHINIDDNVVTGLQNLIEEEKADLLILCAHGYTGDPHQPCGHITRSLIASSRIPVLTVQDLSTEQGRAARHQNEAPHTKVR